MPDQSDRTQMRPGGRDPNAHDAGQGNLHSAQKFAQSGSAELLESGARLQDKDMTQVRRNAPGVGGQPRQPTGAFQNELPRQPTSPGRMPTVETVDRPKFSGGDNYGLCIIDTVTPLLGMAGKLQSAKSHPDLLQFKRYAISQIQYYNSVDFGMQTEGSPFDRALLDYARYGLCTLIDELIQNTPWGDGSSWAKDSLLVTFFRETWGGEKFFGFLEQMRQQAPQCLPVLSLYYVCLELGFMGKYREQPNGHSELYRIKKDLFLLIDRQVPRGEQELSPRWQGAEHQGRGIIKHIPLWVIGAVTAGIGLLVYVGFYFKLAEQVEPVNLDVNKILTKKPIKVQPRNFNRLGQSRTTPDIEVEPEPQVQEPDLAPVTAGYQDKLRILLSSEIATGKVKLSENDDEIVIKLMVVNSELFASASAQLTSEYIAIVDKVGGFLADSPVDATVTGHSDNLPIRSSIKYPNNLALSQARAEQVRDRLTEKSGRTGFRAFGMADAYPVASNGTKEGRRQNRRVEISLVK